MQQLPSLSSIAVPSVLLLIFFLSYSSQYLFLSLEPGPLKKHELIRFNVLLICLHICYLRSWFTDPGRVPKSWKPATKSSKKSDSAGNYIISSKPRQRWCGKCNAGKPPRAHHCKVCQRCVPKMDHHCPWTANCVSHITFPHFLRFIFYAVVSMLYLEYFLYVRARIVWNKRHMPSYYGPSVHQLVHLFVLVVVNSLTLFALFITLIRVVWSWSVNITTIEGWEIERHEALLRRARTLGGYLDGPNGAHIRIVKQEFPYDIGIWSNLKQGMGTGNILAWLWPLSRSSSVETGLEFEENGFEDPSVSWPPPDPDRISRATRISEQDMAFTYGRKYDGNYDEKETFRKRQEEDYKRWSETSSGFQRRRPFHQRYDVFGTYKENPDEQTDEDKRSETGEEGWRNWEGERLGDFGVDEEVEFYDEKGPGDAEDDDIPLSELIRRKKLQGQP
ncbi:zf-DHHC-domain-containing protein [Patellaria atrata CBS 101060]|uniref:Palmitoyltransferase PFA4 n=1 Tax=Patellaria atrata CBS 101060 TaxID=1346257 RepID=A0A9P4S4W6_9PEZI|nr:zf-DHHC-domain-containing protein [Patellaria atrata CBS 101060]